MKTLEKNGLVLKCGDTLDIKKTFECGQCFRFDMQKDGSFVGAAYGRYIKAYQTDKGVFIENGTEDDRDFFFDFFDLGTDYSKIEEELSFDPHFKSTVPYSHGIRILNQEPWETLCSFIISQNNNIPRIKRIVSSLCENFGEKISGCDIKSFPSAEKISVLTEDDLAVIRSGFRAKYISDAAKKVASGEIDLKNIKKMSYPDAKNELMKIKGVGKKVADCALLFSLGFKNAFPIDVWVNRVIGKYYGEGFDPSYFGKYAGIAQQYLFYYERESM